MKKNPTALGGLSEGSVEYFADENIDTQEQKYNEIVLTFGLFFLGVCEYGYIVLTLLLNHLHKLTYSYIYTIRIMWHYILLIITALFILCQYS